MRDGEFEMEFAMAAFGYMPMEQLLTQIQEYQNLLETKPEKESARQAELEVIRKQLARMMMVWDYRAGGVRL